MFGFSLYLRPRLLRHGFLSLALCGMMHEAVGEPIAPAVLEINGELWKQRYGVLDAQVSEQPPYAGWLSEDADGDGVKNHHEFLAGTNPFTKSPGEAHFRAPVVATHGDSITLTFPTVPGKIYQVESSSNLVDAWSRGTLPSVIGDGSTKTLTVPMSAGNFFQVGVSDRVPHGDGVSDWAKHALGLSAGLSLQAQTSFDHHSLVANLEAQNVVSLYPSDPSATQPLDAATPSNDIGVLKISRSGHILLGDITVPLIKSGTAVEGVDYAPLPDLITFPAGVNSIDIRIAPLRNSVRSSSATVVLSVTEPGSPGAAGGYTLGSQTFAGVTIYPGNKPNGTGLTGSYHPGSSSTYPSVLNFNAKGATYNHTKVSNTSGNATITFTGMPATPFAVGAEVSLQFTSGYLSVAAYNSPKTYVISSVSDTGSFVVPIGGTVPNTGTGNVVIHRFSPPLTRVDPVVDFNWGQGTPNGNTHIEAENYSVTWEGFIQPTVAGNYVFRIDADDKARVRIDTGSGLQQILENGWDSPATGNYKSSAPLALLVPSDPAGRYRVVVDYVETTGAAKCRFQWQINDGSFSNIPSSVVFQNNTTAITGWVANYYANPSFTPPVKRTQTDSAITNGNGGDWLTGAPFPSMFHDGYSIRWSGQILPQYSQTYHFEARTDDGVKLWVNNQLVIDRWATQGVTALVGSIDLKAGVFYDIVMEYFEHTSSAEARLSWFSEDQPKQVIPTHRLFPTRVGAPTITSPTEVALVLGAPAPFSMPISSSNGGIVSASGLPPWLTLSGGVLSGVPPAAGTFQFTVTTANEVGTGSALMTLKVHAAEGQLTRDIWTSGVSGPSLAAVPWNASPSETDTLVNAEDSSNHPPNTGKRLRGYFTAPVTGNYYFWIAASHVAELWISNDDEVVNKVRRAHVAGPVGTPPRTWDAQRSQKSPWLSLVAGKRYYLEILHNTGDLGVAPHLSVAWFLDPTGSTPNPVANGGDVMPQYVFSTWDHPPTTAIAGTPYVTQLQAVDGLEQTTATGGAFLRVDGSSAVLRLDHSGLTSGIVSKKIYNSADQVVFDLDAQDRNFPDHKTRDGGYTWQIQPADRSDLEVGGLRLQIATVNHPTGEVSGVFRKTAGSRKAPPVPQYPVWSDLHATSDAANSRFLTQASFGPSPEDMQFVKTHGYREWIEQQFNRPATLNLPFVLANPSKDPGIPYSSSMFFNSWWKNAVTAPDQLRQRVAFALSQIHVVSDNGPFSNNGVALAAYYDTLLEHGFGNFRDILKEVTLSPAMGEYLDMRGNSAGNIQTGVRPNENFAREILQLFSAGLYRVWADGTLVLDSKGLAIPTYDQSAIDGLSRVFTGWNWGQPLVNGRLPSSFSPSSNYRDPMVLVPRRHELGSKNLLDNVVIPAATVTSDASVAVDLTSTFTVESVHPTLGAGNTLATTITNPYDLNGIRSLEQTLDSIVQNSATGPFICRQLIQRLVTSNPKPEYVHRVVRAFNGEQNVDGVATGVRGDMKEVLRAILLDSEARSAEAAGDVKFGKQREPLLRVTGAARAFAAPEIRGSNYRGLGLQSILITTPSAHRLSDGDNVRLESFVDSEGQTGRVPTAQSYVVRSSTPSYSLDGFTGIATLNAPGYQAGDRVVLRFTSGTLGTTAPFNTAQTYTVLSADSAKFTISIGVGSFVGTVTGSSHTPNNFTVNHDALSSANYQSSGNSVTVTAGGYVTGHQVYLKFDPSGLAGGLFDGVYTVENATTNAFKVTLASEVAGASGTVLIPRHTGGYGVSGSGGVSAITFHTGNHHNLAIGDQVQARFLWFNRGVQAQSLVYTIASVPGPSSFTVITPTAIGTGHQGSGGMVVYPLKAQQWTRRGSVTVSPSTWSVGTRTDGDFEQTPLNASSVFNFYYPDYQFPGEMANAGMTTPEFQLTNSSSTMNLTNAITNSVLKAGNPNGYTSYSSGSGAVTMDLSPYMTPDQTSNAGIPGLVDVLGDLLTGGRLSSGARAIITNYVTNDSQLPYTTPTSLQMRDRVRAIVHLILTSAEYAIQK